MRNHIRTLLAVLVVACAASATASSLTLVARHEVLVTDDAQKKLVRAVFADEPLVADLQLNVFTVEQLPEPRALTDGLRALNDESWLGEVQWSLVSKGGRPVALAAPVVRGRAARERGPDAERIADRDTSVPMTTYDARIEFGALPAGEYALTAEIRGLRSDFHFTVATGEEPGLRDHYLRLKARKIGDFAEFRSLQAERLQANPDRLDVLYAIIDRSLLQAPLEETQSWFQRVLAVAEKNRNTTSDQALATKIENDLQRLRQTVAALPQYYARRGEWSMTRDAETGHYGIRDRRNGTLIRDFSRER
ncbi:MAG TPA: hypothetical protein VGQ36_26845 [Thermoanaerobaculia bacterium]|jgi:hypothetical protein|nr:hypothetical protein [Thermoanaerobaculia bacterium]